MGKNLALRITVAIFGIPALIYICIKGDYFLLILGILLAVIGGLELGLMLRQRGYRANLALAIILPVLFVIAAFYEYPLLNLVVASFLLHTILNVIDYTRSGKTDLAQFLSEMFGRLLPVFYLGLLSSYIIYLGKIPEWGGYLLVFVFLIVWATDTAAYFGGLALGKHKLSLMLSPNKTWEGFYFGFAGALIAGIFSKLIFLDIGWPEIIVLSLAACLLGQIGDLFESGLKRHCLVKDSSSILPGHGGILDRFDSFLFAVPVVYLIFSYWK